MGPVAVAVELAAAVEPVVVIAAALEPAVVGAKVAALGAKRPEALP